MRHNRDLVRRKDPLSSPTDPLDAARQEAWVENIDDPTQGKLVHPDRRDEAAGLLRAYVRSAIWRRRQRLIIPLTAVAFLVVGVILMVLRSPAPLFLGAFVAALLLILSQPKATSLRSSRLEHSLIFRNAAVLNRYYVATRDPTVLWTAAEKVDHREGMLRRIRELQSYDVLTAPRRQELEQLQLTAEALVDEIVQMLDPAATATVGVRPSRGEEIVS